MTHSYELKSGYLIIDKKIFTLELLKKESILKELIFSEKFNGKRPFIEKDESNVLITFDNAKSIELDNNYLEIFKNIKKQFGTSINGKLNILITSLNSFYQIIDFNKDDIRVF